jgi:acetyl-CoA acetyltransferase
MSTHAPAAPQKINLRRPDIMEAVQAQVLSQYRSELVDRIRARGHVLSAGGLTVKLAKDEGNRPDTTIEGLAKLQPVMGPDKWITAGNASQLSDGASAAVIRRDAEAPGAG